MSDERLLRIETRLAALESLVRQLIEQRSPLPVPRPPLAQAASGAEPSPVPPAAVPVPASQVPVARPKPASRYTARGTGNGERATSVLSEEWLGTRGLLAVGVVFLVLAAGYLLKLSFDRGWISPAVRCAGGVLAGIGVGGLGWRLHGRGMRNYGAALIGAGAAIVYLAAWAAGRLYQFLPPTPAIASLAAISLGLAAIAWAIDTEPLGSTAAVGAFFAPIVIGQETGSINLLLLYLGAMGACLGTVGALKRWRVTTFVVALAYFGIATTGVLSRAYPAGLYLYAILGGAAGLYIGLREGWVETRLLAFGGGWGVLGVADRASDTHWPTVIGAIVLSAPVWWRALKTQAVLPDRGADGRSAAGETFYFYLTPILLGTALSTVLRGSLARHDGLTPALVALPYLAAGLSAPRRPFAIVGAAALGLAALLEWDGLASVWILFALAHLWAALDHLAEREDGRWYALVTFAAGFLRLMWLEDRRPGGEASFTGPWALSLWWSIETLLVFAAGLVRKPRSGGGDPPSLRPVLWSAGGLVLLFGVTEELLRFFGHAHLSGATSRLAGGLSVSAWWIIFAAGCFGLGFRRSLKPLRLAGFGVAALALGKVLLIDLSTLDAFYRIGSVLILGLVSLAVAYTYHRRAGRSGQARGGSAV
jgi:uncharacterized membrane protein